MYGRLGVCHYGGYRIDGYTGSVCSVDRYSRCGCRLCALFTLGYGRVGGVVGEACCVDVMSMYSAYIMND